MDFSETMKLFCRKFRHGVADGLSTEQAADCSMTFTRETFLGASKEPHFAAKEESWKPVAAILDTFRICLIGWPIWRGPVEGLTGLATGLDATRFHECFEDSDPTRNPDNPYPIPKQLKDGST